MQRNSQNIILKEHIFHKCLGTVAPSKTRDDFVSLFVQTASDEQICSGFIVGLIEISSNRVLLKKDIHSEILGFNKRVQKEAFSFSGQRHIASSSDENSQRAGICAYHQLIIDQVCSKRNLETVIWFFFKCVFSAGFRGSGHIFRHSFKCFTFLRDQSETKAGCHRCRLGRCTMYIIRHSFRISHFCQQQQALKPRSYASSKLWPSSNRVTQCDRRCRRRVNSY